MADSDTPLKNRTANLLHSMFRALKLIWAADFRIATGLFVLTVLGGLLPLSQAWVAKLIIDSVVQILAERPEASEGLRQVAPYLAVEFGLIFAGSIISQLRRLLEETLNHKLAYVINLRILRKALRLELHHFENAEFYDKMQTVRKQSEYRTVAMMNALFQMAQNGIALASFLALVISFSPGIALLLFGAAIPAFVAQTRYGRLNFRLQTWKAPESRRMAYYEHLLTVDTTAKEIKLFGLGESLIARYSELFWKVFREDSRLARKRSGLSLIWGVFGTLAYYACYALIVLRTIAGALTLGGMTLYLSVFRQSQTAINGLFENIASLYENGLFLKNLFEFLDLPEMGERPREGRDDSPALDPSRGIELENVSFGYAGQSNQALKNINLNICPGEKVALVGENGSGKTTLIKLLTRLYDPTEGRILYQGRDLRDWPVDDLRRRIGVIFQDFVRYQLTLRENVGFGSVDQVHNQQRLDLAAQQGGMDDLLKALDAGWDTTLGGWFQKGRELSGGQWQKVALGRAFMRDGEVLVLDEPTAALDAEKEYEIFRRFKELTAGKTAFLISHRFSTVRMADRIVVMKEGAIAEVGSHAELVARPDGTYARLFDLQAEGYR